MDRVEEWNEEFKVPRKYLDEMKNQHGIDYEDSKIRLYYQSTSTALNGFVIASPFLDKLRQFIIECNNHYISQHGVGLLMNSSKSDKKVAADSIYTINIKSYSSVVNKTYRLNTTHSNDKSTILPDRWLKELDDVCRGTVVCRYLDGPEFLFDKLRKFFDSEGIRHHGGPIARDRGYYAYHMYFYQTVPMHIYNSGIEEIEIGFELQITTQLQEVLYDLTHPNYEKQRIGLSEYEHNWQWQYNDDKFKPAYLAHTLHLLEALILEVRDSGFYKKDER